MSKKYILVSLFIIFILFLLFYIYKDRNNNSISDLNQSEKMSLSVSTKTDRKDISMIMQLGKDKGIFEKNSLNLKWDALGSSNSDAMIVGEYEASFGGITRSILAFSAGENLKLLATPIKGFTTVSLSKYPREEAFKIKKAASNPGEVEMRVKLAFKLFGINPEDVEYINAKGTAGRLALFKNGTVDFTQVNLEDLLALEDNDQYFITYSDEYLEDSYLNGSIVTTEKALIENQDALRAFVKSIYEINNYILDNPSEIREIIRETYEVDEEFAERIYQSTVKSIKSAGFTPDVEKTENLFTEMRGVFDVEIDRPASEFIYLEFAEEAVRGE